MPWTVAALLVNFLLPVLLALGRARLLGALALPLVLLQLAATAIGSALFGVDGAVGAFWVAPSCLAAVLLVAAAGRAGAPALAARAGRRRAALPRARGARLRRRLGARRRAAGSELAQAAVAGVVGCAALRAWGCGWSRARSWRCCVSALVTRPAPA